MPLLAAQRDIESRFAPAFENPRVDVNVVSLAPGAHVRIFQNTHDVVWIALSDGVVRFSEGEQGDSTTRFRAGDARLFRSFQVQTATNVGNMPLRAAAVQLKDRGLTTGGCGCIGASERAVCGCAGAPPLPAMWAVAVGQVTLAATTLEPGSGYAWGIRRNDMLLVAVTNVVLQDDAAELRLAPGEATWFAAGRRRFRNLAPTPIRFVTLEF